MKISHLGIVMATGACGMLLAFMLVPAPFPWMARESIFELTARDPKKRNLGEPDAGGGLSLAPGDSEAAEGQPPGS